MGFDLHFSSRKTTRKNKHQFDWHCMPFKTDIIKMLANYGQLPYISPSDSLDQNFEAKSKIAELEKENKILRA